MAERHGWSTEPTEGRRECELQQRRPRVFDIVVEHFMKTALRLLLAVSMVAAGALHFAVPAPYVRIIPAVLPAPLALVYVSGLFEILGGLGLLYAPTRRWAAWGLVALFVAVFPANVNMAVHRIGFHGPAWMLWARLPLQGALIAWAWWFTRPDAGRQRGGAGQPRGACRPRVVRDGR